MTKPYLTSGDVKLIKELSDSFMYGEESTEMIRLKKYLARKNKAVRKQTLEDVRAGVPPEAKPRGPWESDECMGANDTRTTVLEHLDLLGKE